MTWELILDIAWQMAMVVRLLMFSKQLCLTPNACFE
jgi:hypothetical protein